MSFSPLDPDLLEKKAAGGDASAMVLLADLAEQNSDYQTAAKWLVQSADDGYPQAQFRAATYLLQGSNISRDDVKALHFLERAVGNGELAAHNVLAVMTALGLGCSADWHKAVKIVIMAAQKGDLAATRQLGMLLLLDSQTLHADYLLAESARKGDFLSMATLGSRLLSGASDILPQGYGLLLLYHAAAKGHPSAKRIDFTSFRPFQPRAAEWPSFQSRMDWTRAADTISKLRLPPLPQRTILSETPYICTFSGFLDPVFCDYLIGAANPFLAESGTFDEETGEIRKTNYRTSRGMSQRPLQQDLVTIALDRHMMSLAEEPLENGEHLGILHYTAGQEYKPHHDYLQFGDGVDEELRQNGQRIKTCLTLLEDQFVGGETWFPRLNLKIKVAKGDAILFHNVTETGSPAPDTLHAGLPVQRGHKWLATKWIRSRPFMG